MKHIKLYEAFLNEANIMWLSYTKPYTNKDVDDLRSAADDLIYKLQRLNKHVQTGDDAVYFEDYKEYGPVIAVRGGGDKIYLKPLGGDKIVAISEPLLARFMKDGRYQGYLVKGTE